MANKLNLGRIKGTDGTPGTPGTHGKDGKSAYQAAVEGGYTGSEKEFNSALSDVPAHIASKSNPHGVTAQQVGALPLSGGNVTGPLLVSAQDEGAGQMCGVQVQGTNVTIMAMAPEAGGASMMLTPSGTNFTGPVSVDTPSADEHAVNKGYVDSAISTAITGAIEGAY